MTPLDLSTQRYDNVLLAIQTLMKQQIRNKDGGIIITPNHEQGDSWTSLENELNQWRRELERTEVDEAKKFAKDGF